MGAIMFLIGFIPFDLIIQNKFLLSVTKLIIQILIGIASFLILSTVFKVESFVYIKATAKEFIAKKKNKKSNKKD